MDWFLYDSSLCHERVKAFIKPFESPQRSVKTKKVKFIFILTQLSEMVECFRFNQYKQKVCHISAKTNTEKRA